MSVWYHPIFDFVGVYERRGYVSLFVWGHMIYKQDRRKQRLVVLGSPEHYGMIYIGDL